MVLWSADILFHNQFFVVVFSKSFFGNIRVSSSLDPDHARRI